MKPRVAIKRPLVHYVIIIGYILAPIVNILLLRIFGNIPFGTIFARIFPGYGYLAAVWLLTAPLVGIGLYFIHKVSWYVFLGHSSLILIDYILKWVIRPGFYWRSIPTVFNFLMFTGNLLLVIIIGYIIQKDFRAPYFQALKRTWRESERIPINHFISLDGKKLKVSDISYTGCFVPEPKLTLKIGDKVDLNFESYRFSIQCQGEVMRESPEGLGIRFLNLPPAKQRDLRRLMKKRYFLRYAVDLDGLWIHGKKREDAQILDVSTGGCFVHTDVHDLDIGMDGRVDIKINGTIFSADGKLVWLNKSEIAEKPAGFGFKFSHHQGKLMRTLFERRGKQPQVRQL